MKISAKNLLLVCVLAPCLAAPAGSFAQGTAFTYQGRLDQDSSPATGLYDFQFKLYNTLTNGAAVAGPLTNSATGVTNGLFTVTLDFGNVFDGSNRWLEVAVRTNGGAGFSPLAPRQALTATPYAILSASALNATNAGTAAIANSVAANSVTAGNIAGGQVVKTINGLNDAVTLAAGANVTITPGGNTLTIAANAASGIPTLNGAATNTTLLNPVLNGAITGNAVIDLAHGGTGASTAQAAGQNVGVYYVSSFSGLAAAANAAYQGQMLVVENGGGQWATVWKDSKVPGTHWQSQPEFLGICAFGDPYGNMPFTPFGGSHLFTVNGNIGNQTNGVGTGVNSQDVIALLNQSPGQVSGISFLDHNKNKQGELGWANTGSDTFHGQLFLAVGGNTFTITRVNDWCWGLDGSGAGFGGGNTGDLVRYATGTTNYSAASVVARLDGNGNISGSGKISSTSIAATNTVTAGGGFLSTKNNGAAPTPITVNGSPFTFTAPAGPNIQVYIGAGIVNAISKNGVSLASGLTLTGLTTINLQAGESLAVTYSAAPTMNYSYF